MAFLEYFSMSSLNQSGKEVCSYFMKQVSYVNGLILEIFHESLLVEIGQPQLVEELLGLFFFSQRVLRKLLLKRRLQELK